MNADETEAEDLPNEAEAQEEAPIVRETAGEVERRLRRDVARYRDQARTALAEKETAIGAIRAQSDTRLIGAELRFQAMRAGIIDLDVLRLVDAGGIRLAEDGSVEGADAAIESLRQAKPYLFASPTGAPAPGPVNRTGHPQRAPLPAMPEAVDARNLSRDQWQMERSRMLGRIR